MDFLTPTVRRILVRLIVCAIAVCAPAVAQDWPHGVVTIPDVRWEETPEQRRQLLPEYHFNIDLDTQQRLVRVRQVVTWTNRGTAPTSELVFQVAPHNRPSASVLETAKRTLESLRIDPRRAIDEQGRRFHLEHARENGTDLNAGFSPRDDTHLHVSLGHDVIPGETVGIELQYWISIPPVMGRMGQHKGVTNLLNWYPVLAVYENDHWAPVPYIPWHQPWYNEAGNYHAILRLPASQTVITGGHVVREGMAADGRRELQIAGFGLRDFTIICSARYREWKSQVNGIPLRVVAFPEHARHAELALKTAEEAIAEYETWFGPYPYQEFELAESYFGWNGNESSGVVMIDERIFDTPRFAGRYLEHLISHEICHQWWYSAVGTNGYAEPWMDEGLVQWFTRVHMEDKYGPNPQLMDVPSWGPIALPNVEYRSLVHNSYLMYRDRGGSGKSLGSLDDMGHLHNLFFLVYDRGARITGMIQNRMGRDRFFAFLRLLFQRYQYRILTAADFQRELELYTGEDWSHFFNTWLRSDGATDWKLDDVNVTPTESGYRTEARISQQGDIAEPVRIGLSGSRSGRPFQLATLNEYVRQPGVTVRRESPNDWLVTIETTERPAQVIIDPDQRALDINPSNNVWKTSFESRISPFYSPVDEASLIQPWQEKNVVAGFGVDGDGRFGLRGSLAASNEFRVSPFIAYTAATARSNDDHLSAGIDAVWYNLPTANWQILARYEYGLLSTIANDPGHQARLTLRRVLQYTTSLIYPNLSYLDFYTRVGDNFFPDRDTTISPDPRVQNYDNVRAVGAEFHIDTQMPYWDPDRGVRFDAGFEHGFEALGDGDNYNRVQGQLGIVQRLSAAPGWLSETKLAGRLSAGYGWETSGQHFRFGGPGRFRGVEAMDVEGNAFWLSSAEWRFPLSGEIDMKVLENTAALHSVDGALFYDFGRSYLFDDPQGPIDHAIGGGLYFELPLLSFVENLTIRTEYGYSLVNKTSAFWFGLYRAF